MMDNGVTGTEWLQLLGIIAAFPVGLLLCLIVPCIPGEIRNGERGSGELDVR
jgi:hypothetical protein